MQSTQAVIPAEYKPVSMVTQNTQPLEVVIVGWQLDKGLPVSLVSCQMGLGWVPLGPAIRYGLNNDPKGIPTYVVPH